jgi:2-polyprenyl-3-methyl-5-hydroxy-6-metoxy-1,4-benzoquinol methylase
MYKENNLTRTRKTGEGQDSFVGTKGRAGEINREEIGYTDCGCNAGFEGGIVLDPFMGSGTTARVALKQGKRYLGIDLKQEYIDMANKGIKKVEPTLF